MRIKESDSNITLNRALFALYILDILSVKGHDNSKNESYRSMNGD